MVSTNVSLGGLMKPCYYMTQFKPFSIEQDSVPWYRQRDNIVTGDGKYIMVFEGVAEAIDRDFGRFVLHRIDCAGQFLGHWALAASSVPENFNLYIRGVLQEADRAGLPVKLLVNRDGYVLRAELYHEYWEDYHSGKKPS